MDRLLALVAAILLPCGSASADELYARVVDVGNAMCVVISAPGGGRMLYDAGGTGSGCLKAVRQMIGPARINLMVFSHSDADHIGEADDILKAYAGRVDRLVYTGRPGTSEVVWPNTVAAIGDYPPGEVRDLVGSQGHALPNVVEPLAGQSRAAPWRIALGDAQVTFVAGWDTWTADLEGMDDSELNNVVSIVVRIDYGGRSLLLTGDTIGRLGDGKEGFYSCLGAEAWMVKNAAPLIDVDVLIGQHHGGDNSSSRCFIEAVSPKFVVFPAGHVSKYKHVRLSTARRFTGDGTPGAAMITPGGRMFQTDRGDDQGDLEWSPQRVAGCQDVSGDDDVEVFLSASADAPRVRYRTPNGACKVPKARSTRSSKPAPR